MLKCAIFANFLDFENGCCYLNTIACMRRKTQGFLAILLKNRHYFIVFLKHHCLTLGWSWEKNMLKCAILADFLDCENGCGYLNTIARKRRKNTWVSCIFA